QPSAAERANLRLQIDLLRAVTPARSKSDPDDAAFRVYAALPPPLRERLWQGGPVGFAWPAEPGRAALNKETAIDVAAGRLGSLSWRENGPGLPDTPVPFRALERLRGELALGKQDRFTVLLLRRRILGSHGEGSAKPTRVEWVGRDGSFPTDWPA